MTVCTLLMLAGQKPRPNCSGLHLKSTDFNAVAVANVSLTSLLRSRFP